MESSRVNFRVGVLLALSLTACAQNRIGDAVDASKRHFAAFARFESWAERVEQSDVALRGEAALRETMFAPVRSDRAVLWAEVRAEAGYPLQFPAPLALDDLTFVNVDGAELGPLRVAVSSDCRVLRRPHATDEPCVVIAKRVQGASEAPLTMAFRLNADSSDTNEGAKSAPFEVSASDRKRAKGR
ncbi:MAG TPA: hypothetical protein VHZ95_15075 [Polyangiales bacterium]|nr:hypothetical protein [Polyangiales bacterium]